MRVELEDAVARHYGHTGLLERILQAIVTAGGDPKAPSVEDLAPVDEFHTAGRVTTLQALGMLAPKAGMLILDAGCGLAERPDAQRPSTIVTSPVLTSRQSMLKSLAS